MLQRMEIRQAAIAGALRFVIVWLFCCALFALPWINVFRVSTFLLIGTGCLCIVGGLFHINYGSYLKQPFFILLAGYYLMQVIAFLWHPDPLNNAALTEKASLVAIPFLLYVLISNYERAFTLGTTAFIIGNVVAAIVCIAVAATKYMQTRDSSLFFYHTYASPTGLGAIYFSLYILVALGYLIAGKHSFGKVITISLGILLYGTLLLLSSKTAIVTGSALLSAILIMKLKSNTQKLLLLSTGIGLFIALFTTTNPIEKRYAAIAQNESASVFKRDSYSGFIFNGLNLRVVFWRLGFELINEKHALLLGDGGQHYHDDFIKKMERDHLYLGNGTPADLGYQTYNMHNQYMEAYIQYGLVGFSLLLLLITGILYTAIYYRHTLLIYLTILFAAIFFTESAWETQAGILLFTITISGEWIQLQKKLRWKEI